MTAANIRTIAREIPLSATPSRLLDLLNHWNTRRNGHAMPSRADIDVLHFGSLLGWISLLEIRPGSPRFVYRLYGTQLGSRPHGPKDHRPLDEVEPAQHRELLRDQYRKVADGGRPLLCENTLAHGDRRLVYRRLTLPLGDDHRTTNMLLLGYDVPARAFEYFFEPYERDLDPGRA